MDGLTGFGPRNEPVLGLRPGLGRTGDAALGVGGDGRGTRGTADDDRLSGAGGRAGQALRADRPDARRQVLGVMRFATQADARSAVDAALAAAPGWRALSFDDRAAVFLKAADLLAGPWRQRSTPRPCSASRRPPTRPRSTRPAS